MVKPVLDPDVADEAPTSPVLTGYDEEHMVTYMRLLDAAAENADWREVAKIVLHIDPAKEPERATEAQPGLAFSISTTTRSVINAIRINTDITVSLS
ncbi:hypothetical protein [Mesorhizobium sp. M0898]|uniref:hypothetical protein n=1 Tax=Mesorhizobium sp. M0898 TaxID=2957020 RepID=UPI003338FCCA